MSHRNIKGFAVIFFSLCMISSAYSITADEIIQNVDSHRSISINFEMTIKVDSYQNDQFEDSTVMKGYIKDGKVTQISYLEPANMKGRKLLIRDNDMWIVVPNTKNPIRITPSQRLMGGVSYGDVARVSYAEDYKAKLSGEELIAGMDAGGEKSDPKKCYMLELSAKDQAATYYKINLWVDPELFLPVKADFFALSGRKMTTAFYTSPKDWDGKTIITKIFLFDQINTSKHSSMEYIDMKVTQLSNDLVNATNRDTNSSVSNITE